jgi:hypothetical protein
MPIQGARAAKISAPYGKVLKFVTTMPIRSEEIPPD